MADIEHNAEDIRKETEMLKEIADKVVEERESGASEFAVPEDHGDEVEDTAEDDPGMVDELPKAVPHTRK